MKSGIFSEVTALCSLTYIPQKDTTLDRMELGFLITIHIPMMMMEAALINPAQTAAHQTLEIPV